MDTDAFNIHSTMLAEARVKVERHTRRAAAATTPEARDHSLAVAAEYTKRAEDLTAIVASYGGQR